MSCQRCKRKEPGWCDLNCCPRARWEQKAREARTPEELERVRRQHLTRHIHDWRNP